MEIIKTINKPAFRILKDKIKSCSSKRLIHFKLQSAKLGIYSNVKLSSFIFKLVRLRRNVI